MLPTSLCSNVQLFPWFYGVLTDFSKGGNKALSVRLKRKVPVSPQQYLKQPPPHPPELRGSSCKWVKLWDV